MEKNQFGENMFIGKDGKSYSSPEELSRANAIFENREYAQKSQLIGRDGKVYSSPEELFKADAIFENRQGGKTKKEMIKMLEQLKNGINAGIDIHKEPLRREDMMKPEFDIHKEPLRREDMMKPEIDIYNQFGYEDSSSHHKRG